MRNAALVGLTFLFLTQAAIAEPDFSARYPPAGRPWSQRDYVNFYFAHWNGNTALPHLRTAPMRAVFERVVNPENIQTILATTDRVAERRRRINMLLMTIGGIRAAYNYQVVMGEPLQEELVRIQIFSLEALSNAVRLAPKPLDDSGRAAWKTALFGIVQSLAERSVYSDAQAIALATALTQHFEVLGAAITADERAQLRAMIARLVAVEGDGDVKAVQTRLLDVVSAP